MSAAAAMATAHTSRDLIVTVECLLCLRRSQALGGFKRTRVGRLAPTTLPDQRCPHCHALLDVAAVLEVSRA